MGKALAAQELSTILPPAAVQMCMDDVDLTSSFFKGCFGGYSGSTLPTGWVNGAGTPAE